MNECKWIKEMDRGGATPSRVDVTDWVMRDLQGIRPRDETRVLSLVAGVSALAAIVAIVLTVKAIETLQDPLGNLVASLTTVTQ